MIWQPFMQTLERLWSSTEAKYQCSGATNRVMFWGLIHRSKSPENARIEFKIRVGWGGRIRTSDWLIQNQLPYHLATPQRSFRVYRTAPGTPVCRPDRRHILVSDGSARVAPLSGTAVSLLGVWREH